MEDVNEQVPNESPATPKSIRAAEQLRATDAKVSGAFVGWEYVPKKDTPEVSDEMFQPGPIEEVKRRCRNCGSEVVGNKWCCDDCFPLFDGEKFLDW